MSLQILNKIVSDEPMYLTGPTFQQWKENHIADHKDLIFRELYPYNVFELINFSRAEIGKEQIIFSNFVKYTARVKGIKLQSNGRYKATFHLRTNHLNDFIKWKKITWDNTFQIVYNPDGSFTTVFTKKRDPSKEYVDHFFNGQFEKIEERKSIAISDLLFRILILRICKDVFNHPGQNIEFDLLQDGIRPFQKHPQFTANQRNFSPLYSLGRNIWITHAFSEEKAHRVAYYLGNQCSKLFVIYCNPTYSPHHRCTDENVKVVSLHQFVREFYVSPNSDFYAQIVFLQNHLNATSEKDYNNILEEIKNPKYDFYPIDKPLLLEALSIMKIIPSSEEELFHIIAGMNLINAWLTNNKKNALGHKTRTFKEMYFFKFYLSVLISHLLENKKSLARIYVKGNLVMIKTHSFEFSFYNVPKNNVISSYEMSPDNTELVWCQKRLQPIASLIFRLSKMEVSVKHNAGSA